MREMLHFACPSCGVELEISSEHSGATIECSSCQHETVVPQSDTTSQENQDAAITASCCACGEGQLCQADVDGGRG